MAHKRLLVLGATGGTGQHVVAQALRRGFVVTALVRDPARLRIESDQLHVHTGSTIGDEAPLASAMRGQDAVISALGVGKTIARSDLADFLLDQVDDTRYVRNGVLVSS